MVLKRVHDQLRMHLPFDEPRSVVMSMLKGSCVQVMQKRQLQAQHAALATLSFGALAASSAQIRQRQPERRWPAHQTTQRFASYASESVPALCVGLAIPC